jgi:uncharacterized HAD superfamily protein/adenine/guanine phosphoribosyltransferase-like PRPP-binding protein
LLHFGTSKFAEVAGMIRSQLLDFKSLNALVDDSRRLSARVPPDIQAIVGIPRSGMLPAYTIGLTCGNLPVWSLHEFAANSLNQRGHTRGQDDMVERPDQVRRILLVDDVVLTGGSFAKARQMLSGFDLERITTCATYVTAGAAHLVDVGGVMIEAPGLYEWNFLNHGLLEQCCVDMDGVLCFDPSIRQDDDGLHYRAFLERAVPRFRFTRKLKAVVSSRLGKYRRETEEWLARHGFDYEQLYLLDAPDAETRRRFALHAPFKAKVYRDSNAACFIESEFWQAQQIANLSGMSVICTDVMRLVMPAPTPTSPFWLRRIGKPIARRLGVIGR